MQQIVVVDVRHSFHLRRRDVEHGSIVLNTAPRHEKQSEGIRRVMCADMAKTRALGLVHDSPAGEAGRAWVTSLRFALQI